MKNDASVEDQMEVRGTTGLVKSSHILLLLPFHF